MLLIKISQRAFLRLQTHADDCNFSEYRAQAQTRWSPWLSLFTDFTQCRLIPMWHTLWIMSWWSPDEHWSVCVVLDVGSFPCFHQTKNNVPNPSKSVGLFLLCPCHSYGWCVWSINALNPQQNLGSVILRCATHAVKVWRNQPNPTLMYECRQQMARGLQERQKTNCLEFDIRISVTPNVACDRRFAFNCIQVKTSWKFAWTWNCHYILQG